MIYRAVAGEARLLPERIIRQAGDELRIGLATTLNELPERAQMNQPKHLLAAVRMVFDPISNAHLSIFVVDAAAVAAAMIRSDCCISGGQRS
jgi:hypothetical protein